MQKHSGQTDQTHQITLPSAIERVQWVDTGAYPGSNAGLEITTRYVTNGAQLQITLVDQQGRTHGTLEGKIQNNSLSLEVGVPAEAKGALFADVKFPNHGLKQQSPALLILPPVKVKNARWTKDEISAGERIGLRADVEGAPDGTLATVRIFEKDKDGADELKTMFETPVSDGEVSATWEHSFEEIEIKSIPTEEEAENGYEYPAYYFEVEIKK